MTQPPFSSFAGPGERTRALRQAIDEAGEERSATLGLTDSIEPGDFEFTFMFRAEAEDDFVAFDISIIWDGGSHATWSLDISEHEAISMASSAPIYGWHRGETAMTFFWRTNPMTCWRLRVGPVFPVPRRVAVTRT
jgi:hypothetical protein